MSCESYIINIGTPCRMVKVEGRCTQLTLSSLHTYIIIGWHKSIVSSDWSDTMVWFGQILLYLTFHILYTWSLHYSHSSGTITTFKREELLKNNNSFKMFSCFYICFVESEMMFLDPGSSLMSWKLKYKDTTNPPQCLKFSLKDNLSLLS